jgi:hypothetical protein
MSTFTDDYRCPHGGQSIASIKRKFHHRLVSVYSQKVLSQREKPAWCNKFEDGRTAPNDDPEIHRDRPRT